MVCHGDVIEGSVAVGEAPKQTSAKLKKEDIHQQVEEAGFCATDSCGAWDAPMRHNSVPQNDVKTHLMPRRPVVMLLVRRHSSLHL